ncbi:MAG: sulfide/dihydroorotate dehydrogenase-like FAD/NAD-binding protein, partial [Dehalococcoidales bacterium]
TCVMKLVAATTRPFEVKTMASLNPIMIDGTGMCGVCRVIVGGITQFACVDGPEFDAHQVDWDMLMARRCTYAGGNEAELTYQCRNCAQW